jgi:hypothetical protein
VALGGGAAEDPMLEKSGILALNGDPTAEAARVTTNANVMSSGSGGSS